MIILGARKGATKTWQDRTMPHKREFLFYVDDSGSRDPDRKLRSGLQDPDWFALGGVIVEASRKDECDEAISKFRRSWPLLEDRPLHSYEIRNKSDAFRWLKALSDAELQAFYAEISELLKSLPIVVAGCVVHRPGYNARYLTQYGERRWKLCRTAFSIAVERAAKFATHHDARLRVYVERTDPRTESQLKRYFEDLKKGGAPFNPTTSAKYAPLGSEALSNTLYEFKVKTKASDLMQIADLCLWPICSGGYRTDNPSLAMLRDSGKLLDNHCSVDNGLHGIKYSCFD